MKIALVHDYLREYGGAERVLEALHELYPDAPVFTSFVDEAALGIHWQRFQDWDIRQSWETKIPFYKKLFSPLRILSPQFFASFDLHEYDLILSSTNAYFAKAVTVPPGVPHLCYCHTPARSLYGYTTRSDWKEHRLTRWAGTLINHYLRIVDVKIARSNVTQFIANSAETARRIKKFYHLDSVVVYPPIQIPPASALSKKPIADREYYLYVNRLALSKHPELAVAAATELKLPLKVVGAGPMLDQIKMQAGPTVEFLGAVDDETLHQLYAEARALIYPVEDEDFGMIPVEAMGYGVPVIAHLSGGPQETVIEEKTGLFFHELTLPALKEAILLSQKYEFSAHDIHKHAEKYGTTAFANKMRKIIAQFTDPK